VHLSVKRMSFYYSQFHYIQSYSLVGMTNLRLAAYLAYA